MALSLDQIVDRAEASFGADVRDTIVSFVNERQQRMVSEAEWRVSIATVATTVAGQDTYTLDSTLVDLRSIKIGTTGEPLGPPVSLEDIWELQSGDSDVDDTVWAQTFDASGNLQIVLYPAPDTDGDVVSGIEATEASDGAYGASYELLIPKHLRSYLLDGVLADGYEQLDERMDLAQLHEQRFQNGIELLRRLKNTRLGSGVRGIRLRTLLG